MTDQDLQQIKKSLRDLTDIRYDIITERIENFLKENISKSGRRGAVLGLSGGLDSSVVAFLAARALGEDRVLGLIMPDSEVTPQTDIDDAKEVVRSLGIESRLIDIGLFINTFSKHLPKDRLAQGNLRARIRMCVLYYYANLEDRLVLGTGDRSELLIGYFTKYGDGGVDILPIADLYKTQIRRLGQWLGVPISVVMKKSSPRLWAGHEAEDEIGLSYEMIDQILYCLFDLSLSPDEICRVVDTDLETIQHIIQMNHSSEHKRRLPPICNLKDTILKS